MLVLVKKIADMASRHANERVLSIFYASLIHFLYSVYHAFPCLQVVSVVPSISGMCWSHQPVFVSGSTVCMMSLPEEIIELIFCFVPVPALVSSRSTSRTWCRLATRFTHVSLIFRLPPDWQVGLEIAGGSVDLMEEYAVVLYAAVSYFISRWDLASYVLSVSFENWPRLAVCFFYHLFPNVVAFSCRSTQCAPHNITAIMSPFTLPPSIRSVSLTKCSLKDYSIERAVRMAGSLEVLELRGVLHGYVVRTHVYLCDCVLPFRASPSLVSLTPICSTS